jgi:hypothetical protein
MSENEQLTGGVLSVRQEQLSWLPVGIGVDGTRADCLPRHSLGDLSPPACSAR